MWDLNESKFPASGYCAFSGSHSLNSVGEDSFIIKIWFSTFTNWGIREHTVGARAPLMDDIGVSCGGDTQDYWRDITWMIIVEKCLCRRSEFPTGSNKNQMFVCDICISLWPSPSSVNIFLRWKLVPDSIHLQSKPMMDFPSIMCLVFVLNPRCFSNCIAEFLLQLSFYIESWSEKLSGKRNDFPSSLKPTLLQAWSWRNPGSICKIKW